MLAFDFEPEVKECAAQGWYWRRLQQTNL